MALWMFIYPSARATGSVPLKWMSGIGYLGVSSTCDVGVLEFFIMPDSTTYGSSSQGLNSIKTN